MRNIYVRVIVGSVFILILMFNACQSPTYTRIDNLNSRNTSIAGNPLTPVSDKIVSSVCQVITRCHNQLTFDLCKDGVWGTVGIATRLGITKLDGQPFSNFVAMEALGGIYGNAVALNACEQNLATLTCNDSVVQSAYNPNQSQPFVGLPNLFSTQTGSCPNAATEFSITPWTWSTGWGNLGLNYSQSQNAADPKLTAFNGKLYAAWIENNAGYNLRVSVSDGTNPWQFVDGGTTGGINYSATRSAQTPFLTEFNSKLYGIWIESTGTSDLVRLKVYNGLDSNPTWTSVDGGGINSQLTGDAANPEMTVFNSKLYATWVENKSNAGQIRVAVYNSNDSSPAWALVDGGLTFGINFHKNQEANSPRLQSFNSGLYATWSETSPGGIKQIRVARYNGNDTAPSWSFVDGNSATGLNFNSIQNAQNPHLAVSQSKLYLAWQEWNSPTSEQIRVSVFNGNDSLPSWSFADGGKDTGLNWNPDADAQLPQMLATSSQLFITWREQVQEQGIVRVRSFNGNDALPVWPSIDGNLSGGLNMSASGDASFSFKRNPMLVELNSELFLIWKEDNRIQLKRASRN